MQRSSLRWLTLGLLVGVGLLGLLQPPAGATVRRSSAGRPADQSPTASSLHVIPFPGTPDASSGSPIIFSSLAPAAVRSVDVKGSRSGVHLGGLERLPDAGGTEFVPRRPFAPGERVDVSAKLSSPEAGTLSGAPGSSRLTFSFTVGVTSTGAPGPSDGPAPAPTGSVASAHGFHSVPGLHPPPVSVTSNPDTTSGDIFLTPAHTHQKGPMILNSRGQLVWFHRVRHAVTFNLQVQSYKGQPVLTWWQGRYNAGGEDVIMDQSYHTVARVRAVNYQTDPHDFQLGPDGTAWLLARTASPANLTSIGGPSNGNVWDIVVEKIDVATGKLLWEWHAYGHIPLTASHEPLQGTFCDCYHLNSIQRLSDGNLLISSRNTWSVYKVSVKTGHILWTLGGKYSNFKMRRGTKFEWQHDARRGGNTLTLFDDASHPQQEPQSSAKVLHIDVPHRTVTLVKRYLHKPPLLSPAQGSTQILPNGDVFVGWGSEPEFSEYSPDGRQIFAGSFALGTTSYRSLRYPWTGHPTTRPDLAAARADHGRTDVWASWNGATNVAAWQVRGGPSSGSLRALATKPPTGFETELVLSSQPRYIKVEALDVQGKVLRSSALHKMG